MAVTVDTARADLFETALRLGDTALILGQRLSAWTSRAPTLELDIALANQALDLIGQARLFLDYAGGTEGEGRDEDRLAYFRDAWDFRNALIVELPNGDFAMTMMRQFLYSAFALRLYEAMTGSRDDTFAAIAGKAVKETAYHARHSGEWVVRLGDGTEESHARVQAALDELWPYTHELFMADEIDKRMVAAGVMPDLAAIEPGFREHVEEVLAEATLDLPQDGWMPEGGRRGRHTEHLGFVLAEMQVLQRTYPGATW